MKKFFIKKALMFLVIFLAAVTVFSFIVMGLWNALLPAIIGVKAITFWQAVGILVLSKILFGGFGGRSGWRGGSAWKEKMKQRWQNMTPDEREKFKAEWKNRCGSRWSYQPPAAETLTKNSNEM
jgi:Ca2+/H+ antiporter, TMEM165/GDT1 family